MSKKYYIILFLEYFIYSFPIIVVLILKLEYFYVVIYLILIVLYVIFPRTKTNKTNYPFQLFDPFWHISFRKYKLILLLPIALFLVIMGKIYSNQNLSIAAIIIASIIASLPSFERESKEQIKMSFYQTKHYLLNQIKISFINTSYLLVPIALAILFCQQWQLLIYLILIFVLPIINILFKYSCFSNPFSHQIFALLFLGTVVYGIPLLILPFLYFKSIKNLEIIQNVTNKNKKFWVKQNIRKY